MASNDPGHHPGPAASALGAEGWHKPWSGTNGGSCVEAKRLPDGRVALRHSTDPAGPALVYSREEMIAFLEGVKAGRADFLTD
ncbi:DUF397 domain-containing protein [Streptomyces poonensis]|uniref:DUF397 domain-containing protein n=1 Tax=Streptomyces poonensis TaxID=68255 RepID=A0A918PE71_9ACTN|nr:DUF397 domain-containing protein [Streptomyces poonensis]GGZ00443.1 hypothetical protein GCM10010365_19040 [Streptomyces poonensis]GLJ93740.1 hypothetical protein GCM10017589_63560 [Streptomyces poonensis]